MYRQKAVPKKLNQVKTERWFRTSSTEPSPSFNLWAGRTAWNTFKNPSIFQTSYVQLTHGYSMITRLFQKSKPLESQWGHLPKVASLDKNHMLPRSHGPTRCLRTDSTPNSLLAEVHRQPRPPSFSLSPLNFPSIHTPTQPLMVSFLRGFLQWKKGAEWNSGCCTCGEK